MKMRGKTTGMKQLTIACSGFVMVLTALLTFGGLRAAAQAPVVSTRSTVRSSLQGVTGGIAVNKYGDVFQASTWEGNVYEFPANGSAPIVLFSLGTGSNYSGKGLGGVAVDANQNLYVTTIYVGAQTGSDSAIYQIPYTGGGYPAGFVLNAPVGRCATGSTSVCAWGNFLQATGYYYQGWDFAMDGNGVGYLATLFDNNHANDIYVCNAACEARTQDGTILVSGLPQPVLSLAADFAGDVFFADGTASVYEVAAGTTHPVAVSSAFNTTIGVAVDQAGNLYVTDSNGIYKISRVNGSYSAATQVQVVPLPGATVRGYNGGGVAIDLHGNLYAATGYTNLYKYNLDNGSFAAAATGSGSSTLSFNVTLNRSVTSLTATPVGAQAAEFQVSGSTCGAGGAPGQTCAFTGTFTPAGVGLRKAALSVTDSAGNSVAMPVAGIGMGAGISVDPGTLTQVAAGFKTAAGVAVGTNGDVFLADTVANTVSLYPAGTSTAVSVGAGLTAPTGVAVDGGGNLYIADTGGSGAASGRVVEVPAVNGSLSNAGQTTVASGLGSPQGIFVDGAGTLYVADSMNKNIFVLPASQFGQSRGGATFGTGLATPSDVVADATGSLYIADPTNNQVVRISPEGVQSQVGSGLSAPTGVALDASGSVLIADRGNKRLLRVPNESGSLNANDQVTISVDVTSPYALRSDAAGNLVVSDNSANVLDAIARTTGSAQFLSVNVNTTSSAQAVYVSNEGNTGLNLNAPLYTAPAPPFSLVQSTPACAPGTTLGSGLSCALAATFAPTSRGRLTVNVPFATTAANVRSASLNLAGTGLFLATATVGVQQTSPTGTPAYGQTIALTATVTGVAGSPTPTGGVTLVVDGAAQPTTALNNGIANLTVVGLSGGTHTLVVDYFGDTDYAAAQSTSSTVTVTPASSTATLAITATAINPISAAVGSAVTFSSTLTPSRAGFFSGTVNFVSGTTILASATATPGANGTYLAATTSSTVPVGMYQVMAVYAGNGNYSPSSSASLPLTITPKPTLVVTTGTASISSSATVAGSTTLTITSYSGFQGGVDLACSGLPANAVCQFNPAVLTLIASSASTPVSVPVLTTTLTVLVNQAPVVTPTAITGWGALVLLLVTVRLRSARRTWRGSMDALGLLSLLVLTGAGLSGCGSSTVATPHGTTPFIVMATATPSVPDTAPTSSTGTQTASITLNLTVQ